MPVPLRLKVLLLPDKDHYVQHRKLPGVRDAAKTQLPQQDNPVGAQAARKREGERERVALRTHQYAYA